MGNPAQSYRVEGVYSSEWETHLRATGRHLSYGVICHKWTGPVLTPTKQADFLPGGMEGWVDLGGWLHTEMVIDPSTGSNVTQWRAPELVETNVLLLSHATTKYTLKPFGFQQLLLPIFFLHSSPR